MMSKAVLWALLLVGSVTVLAGCGKNPKKSDPEPRSKWVILNEGREINTSGVDFVDSLHGWALSGTVPAHVYWRTTDGGTYWKPDTLPTHSHLHELRDLAFVNESNVWLVGIAGLIYHTQDGGESWTIDDRFYKPRKATVIKRVFFPDSLNGWVWLSALYEGWQIARTTDAGREWEVVAWGKQLLRVLDKNVAFAQSSMANILRTSDGGTTWEEIYPGIPYLRSGAFVSFISEAEGWATISWRTEYDAGSFLIHTEDGGDNWDTLLTLEHMSMDDIHVLPSGEGWLICYPPFTLLRTVDGIEWHEDPLPDIGDRQVSDLIVLPGPHAWVVVDGLVLARTID